MTEYRDPFDISVPTKSSEKKERAKKTPKTKAVVRRVGIGPLLHSRFTKLLTTVGIIILAGLCGYLLTFLYLTMHQ